MLNYFVALLIVLTLCSQAFAQNTATDIVKEDLIDAPDSVVRIQDLITETITIKLPPGIPYTISPEPENVFTFIDDNSKMRIVFIHNGMPPGYTVEINYAVIHPTEDELSNAPTVPDPNDATQVKAFKDYLRKVAKDEIYRDKHYIRVGSPTPPPPPPVDLTEIEKKVRDWANGIDKTEVTKVAENYGSIAQKITDGDYKSLQFSQAAAKILAEILEANQKVANDPGWASVKENLRVLFNGMQAEGNLDSLDKIRNLFKQIQTGLEASLK